MTRNFIKKNTPFVKKISSCLMRLMICQVLSISVATAQKTKLIQYVEPLSGTSASTTKASQHIEDKSERLANTIPAVAPPFAMTQWTPQTQLTEKKCIAPYYYSNQKFYGFRASHWISGSCTQDYGSFTIMPISGKLKTNPKDYATDYNHQVEVCTPAYYKYELKQYKLISEITASRRCGILQVTALKTDSVYILITPNSDQEKGYITFNRTSGEISGYNPVHKIYQGWGEPAGFSGYFYIKINRRPQTGGVYSEGKVLKGYTIKNQKDIGVFVGFYLKKGEKITLKAGTSFTSIAAAKVNLQSEINTMDFESVKYKTESVWEKALGQVKINDYDKKKKRIFYTAMYHSQQHPRLFNDVEGTYPEFSGNYKVRKVNKGNYYDDFSMWDIYRAQLPLLELLNPDLTNSFVNSLILKGQQGRWLPIFPCWNNYTAAMIGDHSTAFIASAYNKGIRNYNVNEAYRLMRKNAFQQADSIDYLNGKGRRGLKSYLKYGYIPLEDSVPEAFHKREQVSRTLEYAYDDYALSTMAKRLRKTKDFEILTQRAKNYQMVFDKHVGMVRGRYADGQWYSPFLADHREKYITEGTPRQYSFYVPQDVPGLASLMGGQNILENQLDSLFEKGEYWHGNEPGHQIPFLYNFTKSPWKTQKQVTKILNDEYDDGPGGLSGNDDAGQMSAWFVFAALGLYPVDPVSGKYELTNPMFQQADIRFLNGKTLQIKKISSTKKAIYIQKILLNGNPIHKQRLDHQTLLKGGTLTFYLQESPKKAG